jgi:hypothetical protein
MKSKALLWIVSLPLAVLCSCSTPDHLPEYTGGTQTGAPGIGSNTAEGDGVIVSLEPFADKARCETYFALNAPAAGIAILHLRVENRSTDSTWILRKSQCKLLLAGSGSSLNDASTARSTASGEALAITGAALMGLGSTPLLIGLGSHQVKQASTVQRNFTEKELRDMSLSPGQMTEGFVYYAMPKKNTSFQGTVQLSLVKTQNQQTNTVQIPLSYEVQN